MKTALGALTNDAPVILVIAMNKYRLLSYSCSWSTGHITCYMKTALGLLTNDTPVILVITMNEYRLLSCSLMVHRAHNDLYEDRCRSTDE